MTRKWCGPPIQAEDQRAGVLLRFGNLDYPDNIEKAFRAHSNPHGQPRQCAAGPRPLGLGDQAALEAHIEQLAYGEALPDDLTEVRHLWWDMARQGMLA